MFKKYYSYLFISCAVKKSVWIVNCLIWLFFLLILIIIPVCVNIDPLFLWTNQMFNFNLMTIIFLANYAGVLAILIFNQPIEDGTELLIFSKPIFRWKIIISKFLVYITFIAINFAVSMIIPIFCLCLGKYDQIVNPKGFKVEQLGALEISLFLATLIISFFFGSIAILISLVGNKSIILVSTMAIAVVFELISTITPSLVNSPNQILSDKYGISIRASNYFDVSNNHYKKHFMTFDDGLINDDVQENQKEVWEWNNIAQKESKLDVLSYLDVGSQMASLFQQFSLNGIEDAKTSSYGSNASINYLVNKNDNVFDFYDPKIDENHNFQPMIWPFLNDGEWSFNLMGIDQENFVLYKAIGCSSESIYVVDDQVNKLKSQFINFDAVAFEDSKGNNLINEKFDGEKYVNGCYEYGEIRKNFIDFVLNKGKLDNIELLLANFLSNSVHVYETDPITKKPIKGEKISDSGLEAIIGVDYNKATDKQFSMAFTELSLNLGFDLWDMFYGHNTFKQTMFNPFNNNETPFVSKVIQEFENDVDLPKSWKLYNNTEVNNFDFFSEYRFLFYENSLNYLLSVQDQKDLCLNRFFSLLNNPYLNLRNLNGFVRPENVGEVTKLSITEEFQINTFKNNIRNLDMLRRSYWYDVRKYVSNLDAIVIWLLFSLIMFSFTILIYWRTDIK